ncbi:hypothetical protein BJ986_000280 [Phycicoccus badiiscoriae]|uniref:Uncharacterized protein n=1 Tax=Pedococcus badiiscoriae TaxID=642776 RepID=A0A852W9T6_9MICO|nr:hypothetical protein [Pedococcus badiiscoriae]NYG05793.1 hypothetical protein [Pedococcus badiiscoriae]
MQNHPDAELTDQVLGSEIELLADLIDAASRACAHLDPDQIDAALGLCPQLGPAPSLAAASPGTSASQSLG